MDFVILALIAYIIVNVFVMFLYGYDKKKAVNKEWRVPESTLILAAFFGAFGGVLGMRLFHHKTQKPKFYIVYVFAILHAAVILYLFYSGTISL